MYQPLPRIDRGHNRLAAVVFYSPRYIYIGALITECHLLIGATIKYDFIYVYKLAMEPKILDSIVVPV